MLLLVALFAFAQYLNDFCSGSGVNLSSIQILHRHGYIFPSNRTQLTEAEGVDFLRKYGYFSRPKRLSKRSISSTEGAVAQYQRNFQLPVTGQLDNLTLSNMTAYRCGMPDYGNAINSTASSTDFAYFAEDFMYPIGKRDISWRISDYGDIGNTPKEKYDRVASRAFTAWSKVSDLYFYHKPKSLKPDISIMFTNIYNHGCKSGAFMSYALAHAAAYTRNPHEIHINDNYVHTLDDDDDRHVHLQSLLIHEIGHILGIAHNQADSTSIMHPTSSDIRCLNADDIEAVVEKYGKRSPSTCPDTTTRIWTDRNGTTQPRCGTIYNETGCGGDWLVFAIWYEHDLHNQQRHNNVGSWYNTVRSAVVNPGCTLKVCTGESWKQQCTMHYGGEDGLNVPRFDHDIASIWCTCGPDADKSVIIKRGIDLPMYIPQGFADKGSLVCALAAQTLTPDGWWMWFKDGDKDTSSNPHAWAYSYLVTRPGCTLTYCEKIDYESCNTLLPRKYIPITGDYGLFKIRSYKCTCT